MKNAVVRIDADIEQTRRVVTKQGTYRFTVPAGTYELTAIAEKGEVTWGAEENITVSGDGEYDLDIILQPLTPLEEIALEAEEIIEESSFPWALSGVLLLLVVAIFVLVWYMRKKVRTSETSVRKDDRYRSHVLRALRKAGSRATQRELCRAVPFSSAKVSLVLTELEEEGKIKKIRKGRANVIVLK